MRIGRDVTSIVAALHASWPDVQRGVCVLWTPLVSVRGSSVVTGLLTSHRVEWWIWFRSSTTYGTAVCWDPANSAEMKTTTEHAHTLLDMPSSSFCFAEFARSQQTAVLAPPRAKDLLPVLTLCCFVFLLIMLSRWQEHFQLSWHEFSSLL